MCYDKNLNLTDVYIKVSGDASKAGGIAGNAAKTQILNCTVNGTVIGYDGYYGGITGSASGTISGCEFDGTVKAVKDLKNGQSGLAYLGGITGDFHQQYLLWKVTGMKKQKILQGL